MTSTKLSEAEKQEIIRLYQDVPEETTITLAERYGVSSSTVRRVLQNAVPKDVYDILTAQKQRLHRTGKRSSPEDTEEIEETEDSSNNLNESLPEVQVEEPEPVTTREKPTLSPTRRRKRSSVSDLVPPDLDEAPTQAESASETSSQPDYPPETPRLEQLFADDLIEQGGTTYSEYDEDDEEGNEDEDDEEGNEDDEDDYLGEFGDEDSEDDDDDEDNQRLFTHPLMASGTTLVKILPLTETALPKTCYLVIDRSSELIAKPLRAFSELGRIPEEEIQEKTLPVFDNHRVASRFSGRNQRVFKVPDGRLLRKAAPHLQAKGITRLLIDGQVYRF